MLSRKFVKYYCKPKAGLVICSLLFIFSCTSVKQVSRANLDKLTPNPYYEWSLEDCNVIITFHTLSNKVSPLVSEISSDDVIVTALPMNDLVLRAISRREAILKRLPDDECKQLLKYYFELYTNHEYIPETDQVIEKSLPEDSLKGLSFQLSFRNNTDPYHPVILDSGYEYFFLENSSGEFARVVEISGIYAETDFYLADYLELIITFNSKSEQNKLLFQNILSLNNYKLVFNGLEEDPIILKWEMLNSHK